MPTDVPDTLGELPRASSTSTQSSSVDPAAAADDDVPGAGDDVLGDMEAEAAAAAATASTSTTSKGKRKRSPSMDDYDWVDDFKATMAAHKSLLEKILEDKTKPATKKDSFIAYVAEYLQAAEGQEFERLQHGILHLMHYNSNTPAAPAVSATFAPSAVAGPSGVQTGTPHYQPYYGYPSQPGPHMWPSLPQQVPSTPQQPSLPQVPQQSLHTLQPPQTTPQQQQQLNTPTKKSRFSAESMGKIMESINNEFSWGDDL